jgi:hypothetical protein
MATAIYDRLGRGYAGGRQPDPRWQAEIDDVLGSARKIVNVGAGTGSYEPSGREVLAVEPSAVMVAQRPMGAAPAVRAVAEALPIADHEFDVAMGVSTLHHWLDWSAGIKEMLRVAPRVAVLHFDPAVHDDFWLVRDYLPELSDVWRTTPSPTQIAAAIGPGASIRELPVPWDCIDGFLSAYWRRPAAYLEPNVQQCMSGLQVLPPAVLADGIEKLRADLESGSWRTRNSALLDQESFDGGWRLIYN